MPIFQMSTPDMKMVRINKAHTAKAKEIGRRLGYKASLVMDTALSTGLPLAEKRLAAIKTP